jgi:8-oxo-dGTP diphosphatase
MASDAERVVRPTLVAAAVIRDADGRILLTRRHRSSHMGGLWEFPGGKVEDGESPAAALARELEEELAVEARIRAPLTFATHEEPGLRIVLLFFEVELVEGQPIPAEGQEIAWVETGRLVDYPTPPADSALVEKIVGGVLG